MFNDRFYQLGSTRSVIRELFEYGKRRKAEIGEDKVFDFSLGNPSAPPPSAVNNSIVELLNTKSSTLLHGYTSAQGDLSVRTALAENIYKRFNVEMTADLLYLTCGAAASLTITLGALCNRGDKIIALAPYFPEYKVFANTAGAEFVVVKPLPDMTIDFEDLASKIDDKVKAVIVNSPNNPSGVVYSERIIDRLAEILKLKSVEFNNRIFIIADEPYREISYGADMPFIMNHYTDTVVCYSYSKSLSLAGERIGYIAVNPRMRDASRLYLAICGAGRAFGYVCAPSLFQQVIKENLLTPPDAAGYKVNRDILCNELSKIGYSFATPDGAFYLFIKSPSGDAEEFCERAKRHEILIVAGNGFGVPSHARISYCVTKQQIINSIPHFSALMDEYR